LIFVTVGTHEQPFNRLIQYMDELKRDGKIDEEVFIQTGYSTYEPQYCQWSKMIPYNEMIRNVEEARIVITHGGPASFIMPLQIGKIPIVVPRKQEYGEHINNHQVAFARRIAETKGSIIIVENIQMLGTVISQYEERVNDMGVELQLNNKKFCDDFFKIVQDML
jgi:UDP-N-acetylglucosamine transferase subunit ALG13